MAEVPLQVVITANSAAIKKALKGIQKDILGTETKTRKEIEKTDRARSRSLQKTKAGAQSLGNEFKKAGAVAQRELEKGILTGTKRGIQKAGSFLRRNRGNFIKGLGAITGAGLITARQGFQTARGITGAPGVLGARAMLRRA